MPEVIGRRVRPWLQDRGSGWAAQTCMARTWTAQVSTSKLWRQQEVGLLKGVLVAVVAALCACRHCLGSVSLCMTQLLPAV